MNTLASAAPCPVMPKVGHAAADTKAAVTTVDYLHIFIAVLLAPQSVIVTHDFVYTYTMMVMLAAGLLSPTVG